jgi:hypothetical protein
MIKRLRKLSSWLYSNGYIAESNDIALLQKEAAKPLPINIAEVESIIDALLEQFKAKFLGYPWFSPFSFYTVIQGQLSLDDVVIPAIIDSPTRDQVLQNNILKKIYEANMPREQEIVRIKEVAAMISKSEPYRYGNLTAEKLEEQYTNSREQRLIDYLEVTVDMGKKKNVRGDDISVSYKLMISDDRSKSPGVTAEHPDGKERDVVLNVNPTGSLMSRLITFLRDNQAEYRAAQGSPIKEIDFFIKSIRSYLIEVLRHEETHVLDVTGRDKRQGETYLISKPNGETIEEIARRLQVDPSSLFFANLLKLVTESLVVVNPAEITRAMNDLSSGSTYALETLYNSFKNKKIKKGSELLIMPRAESQMRVSGSENTLAKIAERTRVKHGAMRLLVINFNDLFSSSLADQHGNTAGPAPSYQLVFELEDHIKNALINMQLPEGSIVRLIPSFKELYYYDRGFYLLTREESKAHYNQIIYQIEDAIKDMNPEQIRALSLDDMIKLSEIAQEYNDNLAVNPVDEIIKTPIGYLDKLKKDRLKLFEKRMKWYWTTNIKNFSDEES